MTHPTQDLPRGADDDFVLLPDAPPEEAGEPQSDNRLVIESGPPLPPPPDDEESRAAPRDPGPSWRSYAALAALALIALGLVVNWGAQFIRSSFDFHPALGWTETAAVSVLCIAFALWILQEYRRLRRFHAAARLRDALESIARDPFDLKVRKTIERELNLYVRRFLDGPDPAQRQAAQTFQKRRQTIRADRLPIELSRTLLQQCDEQARHLIAQEALSVGAATALCPYAVFDALITLWRNLRLIRGVAAIYQVRPGFVASLRLARLVLLAFVTADFSQQASNVLPLLLGHSLRGLGLFRILGQGLINAAFTCRVGLITLELCRPCPLRAEEKQTLWSHFGAAVFDALRAFLRKPQEASS